MPTFTVLYTDRGDYSQDFAIEQRLYEPIDAEIVDAHLDHNAIDWPAYEQHLSGADAVISHPIDPRALASSSSSS